MKRRIGYILLTYSAILFIMLILQMLFMLVEPAYAPLNLHNMVQVVGHGLSMNLTVAAYLSIVPWILAAVSAFASLKWLSWFAKGYYALLALIISLIYVSDAALYPYWGFRLDMTPLFYFATSPSAALASVEWWMWIPGIICIISIILGVYILLSFIWNKTILSVSGTNRTLTKNSKGKKHGKRSKRKSVIVESITFVFIGGLLFLAIRGGWTVSTMNPSRAYFSSDVKLNHAAVNPIFNLLYSYSHQGDFDKQFRFMDEKDAAARVARLFKTDLRADGPRIQSRPDLYIIILEGFSNHLIPSLGGDSIAMSLDSIAVEGHTFTNAYAASFRTDRSLTAILSGYPAPPTTSLLKYVDKLDKIESLPRTLKREGYKSAYYYGGDINFTNVNAWLVASGVDEIISDKDFPMSQRLSKWGAHDGPLFDRVVADLDKRLADPDDSTPRLYMIQTSSSHEPFEVPWNADEIKEVNSFKYSDAMLGRFIDRLKLRKRWDDALVLITADHVGAWPKGLKTADEMHRIPVILTGGALKDTYISPSLLNAPAAQTDIPATLLALLGIDHTEFPWSNDLLDESRNHFAFFTEPSWAAIATPKEIAVMLTETGELSETLGYNMDETILTDVRAVLQRLYDDMQNR